MTADGVGLDFRARTAALPEAGRRRVVAAVEPLWRDALLVESRGGLARPRHRRWALVRTLPPRYTLNRVVHHLNSRLDASFSALSDATRRGVLERLGRGDASITELAEKFHLTLTGMKKHVTVLEDAGLVRTEKVGRVRTCTLGPRRLEDETAWLEGYRKMWDARFDALQLVVDDMIRKEKAHGRKK